MVRWVLKEFVGTFALTPALSPGRGRNVVCARVVLVRWVVVRAGCPTSRRAAVRGSPLLGGEGIGVRANVLTCRARLASFRSRRIFVRCVIRDGCDGPLRGRRALLGIRKNLAGAGTTVPPSGECSAAPRGVQIVTKATACVRDGCRRASASGCRARIGRRGGRPSRA